MPLSRKRLDSGIGQSEYEIDKILENSDSEIFNNLLLEGEKMRKQPENFFEGTEKLLEIWFAESCPASDNPAADLRVINRSSWDDILKLARCEVISVTSNKTMDAYVLSESSMFLSRRRFILKTCGSTTLLFTIKPLLTLVRDETAFDLVEDFFYSHKNWIEPEYQIQPHHSFEDEVMYLDTLFNNGSAHVLGNPCRDCWYLYRLDHNERVVGVQEPDQTLEVLMEDLDASIMKLFHHSDGNSSGDMKESASSATPAASARNVTRLSGIDTLLPTALLDDHLFQPCGYSVNGLMENAQYFTMHVTPEEGYSYVSFETNVPQACFHSLISNIISLFKPGKFLVTIFANEESIAVDNASKKYRFDEYDTVHGQFYRFNNYNVSCLHYTRAPI